MNTDKKVYTSIVEEDPQTEEFYFTIDSDLLSQMGWTDGDDLEWIVEGGTATITKKDVN